MGVDRPLQKTPQNVIQRTLSNISNIPFSLFNDKDDAVVSLLLTKSYYFIWLILNTTWVLLQATFVEDLFVA